jgi:hypothetical protein
VIDGVVRGVGAILQDLKDRCGYPLSCAGLEKFPQVWSATRLSTNWISFLL